MKSELPSPINIVNSAELFALHFLKIRNKNKDLAPLRWNRAQRHFHQNRTGRDIILKARQLGFSTYVQGEMYRRTVTSTRTTLTLAHDNDTTQKLRRMADRYWQNCQFNGIQPQRQYANAALVTYPEFDSASIIGTAGSVQKGRGDTYTDIHGSEVAFWKDAESILIGAAEGGNPDIVLESTPNGAQGYFYELCAEAMDGNSAWTLHFYPWWWEDSYAIPISNDEEIVFTDEENKVSEAATLGGFSGGLSQEQIKWRREKVRLLKGKFKQEYPEDATTCFLTSGNSYFGDVSSCFGAPMNATYNPKHKYSGGIDFAQTNDYLVYSISDRTTNCQVDQLRINHLSWRELRKRVYDKYCMWSGETEYWHGIIQLGYNILNKRVTTNDISAQMSSLNKIRKLHEFTNIAERNSIGAPNLESLRSNSMGVDKFIKHAHPELLPLFTREAEFYTIRGMPITAFNTTQDSKAEIMSEMHEALHTRGYQLLPLSSTKHEYNIFVATQTANGGWRLAASDNGHDDTVIATALDNRAGTVARTTRIAVS